MLDRQTRTFPTERQGAAVYGRVADHLADVGVGHHQHDVATSWRRKGKQIRVEANRPLRAVAAHLPADIGPDFGRLTGRRPLGRLAETSEDLPLREPNHRLLRDLVDFERLAFARPKRESGNKANRRDGFAQPFSPKIRDKASAD